MMNNTPTVIASALLEMRDMYLTQSYEDIGGKRSGLRDSPLQWCCVAQKAIDQVRAVLAHLPKEGMATQNAERVQITLAFQRPVTLPHAMWLKAQANRRSIARNLSLRLPMFLLWASR
jgi:hypothetical protein